MYSIYLILILILGNKMAPNTIQANKSSEQDDSLVIDSEALEVDLKSLLIDKIKNELLKIENEHFEISELESILELLKRK